MHWASQRQHMQGSNFKANGLQAKRASIQQVRPRRRLVPMPQAIKNKTRFSIGGQKAILKGMPLV
jgi:hypothetical protein